MNLNTIMKINAFQKPNLTIKKSYNNLNYQ